MKVLLWVIGLCLFDFFDLVDVLKEDLCLNIERFVYYAKVITCTEYYVSINLTS